MAIEKTETWSCDICEASTRTKVSVTPKGWITFVQENSVVERMFHDRCICPACLKDIKEAQERK